MNAITTTETRALAVERPQTNTLMMDVASMDSMMRVAELMAGGRSTIPTHLQKNPADCMAVVLQAMQWGMNPFAVAQKTHIINGTIGYEAQLISAVINNSSIVKDRFKFEWFGDWSKVIGKFAIKKNNDGKEYRVPGWQLSDEYGLGVRVWATLRGESEPRVLELLLAQARTRNSTLWSDDPKQQLAYLAQKRWARLFASDVILGVYSPDELDAIQPRNMGAVEEVKQEQSASNTLLKEAYEAAESGIAAYQKFWKSCGSDNRKLLAADHERLKGIASQADQERTVNASKQAVDTDTGEIKASVPAKTFDEVMGLICSAQTEDALYVAGEWVSPQAFPDAEQYALLTGKFDERLEALRAKAGAA